MKRIRTFENHEISLYKQVSGSIYNLMDHERHEINSLPVNPNFLSFKDKTINSKFTESLFKDTSSRGPSIEFTQNLRFFYIFHIGFLLISFFTSVLQYTSENQSYGHFVLRTTFLCFIFTVSILFLFLILRFSSFISRSRPIFMCLSLLLILYLIICDDRILTGISGENYHNSFQGSLLVIALYVVMLKHVLFDSFLYISIICFFSLLLSLIFLMVFSTVSVLSGLTDFLILLVFLVIELMETHQVDYRTRQLFWRKHMEEEYLENIELMAEEGEDSTVNINTEIELIIQSCDKIKQMIKAASAVIMYKDVKRKLKAAQNDLEKVKRRMAQDGFTNVVKLEQHPGISEDDKLFIYEHYTDHPNAISKQPKTRATRMTVMQSWPQSSSGLEDMLAGVGSQWNLDIWFIHTSTSHSIYVIGKHLLSKWQLYTSLMLPQQQSDNFFMSLERAYLNNPYHNACHAADVLHNILFFFVNSMIFANLTPLELVSAIIAGLAHDVGHPGFTNKFLINTKDEIALNYNDKSVLENMHIAKTYSILSKESCNLFMNLNDEDWFIARKNIIEMILETDMTKHFEMLGKFRTRSSSIGDINLEKAEDRLFVMSMAIKVADIGHSAKITELHERWTALVCEEFFHQGDIEKEKGQVVSIYCDRETTDIPKSQAGFLKNICIPLYESWAGYLKSEEVYKNCYDQLKVNLKIWEGKIKS